jgi:hypothetical protein
LNLCPLEIVRKVTVKVKGKELSLFLMKLHDMKAYWGVELYLHAFFDLGIRWRWVVSFKPRPLYSRGKSSRYPLYRSFGGPQIRFGRCDKGRKSYHYPHREFNRGHASRSLFTIPTELSRLTRKL